MTTRDFVPRVTTTAITAGLVIALSQLGPVRDGSASTPPRDAERLAFAAADTPPSDSEWGGKAKHEGAKLPVADAPPARPTIDVIVRPLPPLNSPSADDLDRDAIRVVATPPTYPEQLAKDGVEGFVVVEFDITPSGRVENAVVVESKPARVFDQSALSAIKQWVYEPKTVGGEPVFDYGVRQRINYEVAGK